MVDFQKINDDKTFQRLVNHLFSLECNSSNFLPFSPYIGKDGGFDAFYKGYYPPYNLQGKFLIDAKYTKKNLNEAKNHLKREITKKVLKNAKKNKIDHVIVATNAQLRKEHLEELEKLIIPEIKTLYIWYGEQLAIRIEQQPFLRNFYFGTPQHPLLIPPKVYFDSRRKELSDISCSEIKSFKVYTHEFANFYKANINKIFAVHAPGGFGKTHLLRQISNKAYLLDPERQVWMINAGFRSIENAIQDEIISDRKYLLIFDDADRYFDVLNPLLAFIDRGNVDVKVIVGLRTSGIYLFEESIKEMRSSHITQIIKINEWPKEDLIKLLRLIVGQDKVKDEELIVNQYSNPYFIVLIGKQIKKEQISDYLTIRKKIIEDIDTDAKKCLKNVLDKDIEEFLLNIACIVPFNVNDHTTLEHLGQQLDINYPTVKKALSRLLEVDVLRQIGKSIRFVPDMKGDIYLLYKIDNQDEELFKTIISKWMPIFSRNIFVNLGATFRYGRVSIVEKILKEFISEWTNTAISTSGTERRSRLEWIQNIVIFNSQACVGLLNTYLNNIPPKEKRILSQEYEVIKLNTDDYGPVIEMLIRYSSDRNDILCIIEKMYSQKIDGTYDNYKPLTLIKKCISPLRNNPKVIMKTLSLMEKWLGDVNEFRPKIIEAALSELLAATHRYSRSYLDKMEIGEKSLKDTSEIRKARSAGLNILRKMLNLNNITYQLSAITITKHIGKAGMGNTSTTNFPLNKVFLQEKKDIFNEIVKLISPDCNYRLLSEIEDLLIHWWTQNIPSVNSINKELVNFPRDPEYMIYRYFASRMDIFDDFSEIIKKAPAGDKWKWLIHNIIPKKWQANKKDFFKYVQTLDNRYTSPKKVLQYLNNFWKQISCLNAYQMPPLFINSWMTINPTPFEKIRAKNTWWNQVPEHFKSAIDIELYEMKDNHIETLISEIFQNIQNVPLERINTLLILMQIKPPKDWGKVINELIIKGNDVIRQRITGQLYFINKKDPQIKNIAKSLLLIIDHTTEASEELVKDFSFILHFLGKELKQLSNISVFVSKLLNMIKNRTYLEWHDNEIIAFCINNVENFINFIEYRLEKSKKASNGSGYEAIPFDGIQSLKDAVKTNEEYNQILSRLLGVYIKYRPDIANHDIKTLLKQILLLREEKNNKLMFPVFLKHLVNLGEIEKMFICAEMLPLNKETQSLFIQIIKLGLQHNMTSKIDSLLFIKTTLEGGWSSPVGKAPPALLEKLQIYEDIRNSVPPGYLKNILKRCIDSINSDIKDHIDRDKSFLLDRR